MSAEHMVDLDIEDIVEADIADLKADTVAGCSYSRAEADIVAAVPVDIVGTVAGCFAQIPTRTG